MSATVGVVTDLGCPTAIVAEMLSGCDLAVLEFNHDEEMLRTGSYLESLKQRIKGDRGHLGNRQAVTLLGQGLSSRLKTLVLAHLSESNNSPAKALESALGVLREEVSRMKSRCISGGSTRRWRRCGWAGCPGPWRGQAEADKIAYRSDSPRKRQAGSSAERVEVSGRIAPKIALPGPPGSLARLRHPDSVLNLPYTGVGACRRHVR